MSTVSKAVTTRGRRKVKVGVVISNKMQKTIVVRVNRLVKHSEYSKVISQSTSFKAHDETNQAVIGDWVKIMETRPFSKDKRWRLVEILKRASAAPPLPAADEETVLGTPALSSRSVDTTASEGTSPEGASAEGLQTS